MSSGLVDVISVTVLGGYCLRLGFDDGVIGIIDLSCLLPFRGVFSPLKDKVYFATVKVNNDIGTICWSNGADLSPTYLRENIQLEAK